MNENERVFTGFDSGTEIVPTQFFKNILPVIDSLSEIKITLFGFYLLNQFDGNQRYFLRSDFAEEELFMQGLSAYAQEAQSMLDEGLEKSVSRGTFLSISYNGENLYFLNSPKGRQAAENLVQGRWMPDSFLHISSPTDLFRPNIFQQYEDNIGPLTPLISEKLKDAEAIYSSEWITDAIEISVVNNARSWRYIEAILKSWKENGRDGIYR